MGVVLSSRALFALVSGMLSTGAPLAIIAIYGPAHLYELFGGACVVATPDLELAFVYLLWGSILGALFHYLPLSVLASGGYVNSLRRYLLVSLALQLLPFAGFLSSWYDCSRDAAIVPYVSVLLLGGTLAAKLNHRFSPLADAETA